MGEKTETPISLWLACDKDNELVLFKEKPYRDEYYGFWCNRESGIRYSCNEEISAFEHKVARFTVPRNGISLTWEDEPMKVGLTAF